MIVINKHHMITCSPGWWTPCSLQRHLSHTAGVGARIDNTNLEQELLRELPSAEKATLADLQLLVLFILLL